MTSGCWSGLSSCPTCAGKGYIYNLRGDWQPCPRCNEGDWQARFPVRGVCPVCNGKDYAPNALGHYVPCPRCNKGNWKGARARWRSNYP